MDHENVKTVNLTTNQKRQCEEISLINTTNEDQVFTRF